MFLSRRFVTGLFLLLIVTPVFSQDCVDYNACADGLFKQADVQLRAEDVVIANGVAYTAGGGDGFVTYSLTDPESPALLSVTALNSYVDQIALDGSHAYLGGQISHGFQVIDITSVASPLVVGQWHLANAIDDLEAVDGYVYVAEVNSSNTRILRCVDVSDVTQPVAVSFADTLPTVGGSQVMAAGNLLYFSTSSTTRIYDLANPSAPALLSEIAVGGSQGIAVVESLAYFTNTNKMTIVDVAVSAVPVVLSSYLRSYDEVMSMCVLGDVVYLGTSGSMVELVDISNPQIPVYKGTVYAHRASVPSLASSGFVYLGNGLAGFYVLLPGGNAECSPGVDIAVNGNPRGLVKVGDYIHVVTRTSVETFDVTDPTAPVFLSTLSALGEARDIATDGTFLYVAVAGEGVRIASGAGSANCQWVGLLEYSYPRLVAVQAEICWVVDSFRGLCAVDISDPMQPVPISELVLSQYAGSLAVEGNLACVGMVNYESLVIEISNPAAPVPLGSLQGTNAVRSVAIRGSLIYVAEYYAGLTIFDTQSGAPFQSVGQVWSLDFDTSYSVAVSASTAYLGWYSGGVGLVDISDPAAPFVIKRLDVLGAIEGIVVEPENAYFVTTQGGLHVRPAQCDVSGLPTPVLGSTVQGDQRILFWSLPENPLYLETCVYRGTTSGFELIEPLACTPNGGYVETYNGTAVYVIRFRDVNGQLTQSSNEISFNSASAVPELSANWSMAIAPNPFNPTTVITFTTQQDCDLVLDIFDLRGRLVGQLFEGSVPAGEKRILWQGQDQSGQNLPSGTYFIRAISGTGEQTQRVMLLK